MLHAIGIIFPLANYLGSVSTHVSTYRYRALTQYSTKVDYVQTDRLSRAGKDGPSYVGIFPYGRQAPVGFYPFRTIS